MTLLMSVFASVPQAFANGEVLGVHILHPSEIDDAVKLLKTDGNQDAWQYVTVPLSLNDLKKQDEWQKFFDEAKKKKIKPIVRFSTKFENGAWKIPNKKEIVDLTAFVSELEWPTDEKYVIVFNEVNHKKEWGNSTDPAGYAEVLRFTSDWLRSEGNNYKVLPAAMDLAAPNGSSTQEAFGYLTAMMGHDPGIWDTVDYWNSHSYPNPGFSSSPQRDGKNSLRGFQYELAFLKEKTGKDFKTFITETGWTENGSTSRWLATYYEYARQHIWSDSRVMAVTPFILRGDPGPFSGFTLLDRNGKQTRQYVAYREAIEKF
jgi:hypothetical protein